MKLSLNTSFNKLPIRTKLTIWYALSFMAVMAFSFVSFFYVTRSLMLSKVDDTLKSQVEEITNILKEQSLSPASKEFILETFSVTKTNLVIIANTQGEVVAQAQSFTIDTKLYQKLLNQVDDTQRSVFITEDTTRFHIIPIYTNEQRIGTVIVGDSILAINNAFNVLFNTLILIFFIFALPLILVSFLEADVSLSPLRDIVQRINSITTKNLSARVDILNPKDEIGEVSTSVNLLLDRLQRGFEKERQLIYDISHQLKTPLTAIRSDIEIVLSKRRAAKTYEMVLKDLLNDTTRMSGILKDLVNFAWASSEQQDKSFTKIDLSRVLEECSEITVQLGLEKNITVSVSIPKNLKIMGQREKLFQALLNILENSVKYTTYGGKIDIRSHEQDDEAKIIIRDSGIGITKQDLPYIFDRFYRGKSEVKDGSGLGLSIAGALIKAHRGTIEVTSKRGKGTTFVITIPLVKTQTKPKRNTPIKISPITIRRPHVRKMIKSQLARNQFTIKRKNSSTSKTRKMKKTS
jgi:signal transduction histidine kinase